MRTISRITVDIKTKNPYQMFTRMSSQAYLAKTMCSRNVCGRMLFLQKVSLFRRNTLGKIVQCALKKTATQFSLSKSRWVSWCISVGNILHCSGQMPWWARCLTQKWRRNAGSRVGQCSYKERFPYYCSRKWPMPWVLLLWQRQCPLQPACRGKDTWVRGSCAYWDNLFLILFL